MTIRRTILVVVSVASLAAVAGFVWPGVLRGTPQRAEGALVFQGASDPGYAIYLMRADGRDQKRVAIPLSRSLGFPRFSPDGRTLAFIAEAEDGHEDLYLADAKGQAPRSIAPSLNEPEGAPAWSPDGTTIVFASKRDGNWEIYSVHPDGTALKRLTNDAALDVGPVFAPDGRTIAFSSDRAGGEDRPSHLYVMNVDGTAVRQLTFGDDESAPDYSPDGRSIAFVGFSPPGNADIWVARADGTDATRVTTADTFEYSPRWSPDGRWLAFEGYLGTEPEIFLVQPDGSDFQQLTTAQRYAGAPAWVPSAIP